MKTERKVLAAAVALGLAIWLVDALQDYWFFYEGSFLDLLIADVPSHELIVRGFLLFCAVGFGGITAGFIKQLREREDESKAALMEAKKRQIETQALLKSAEEVLKRQGFTETARAIFDNCREVIGAPAGYISLATEDGTANEAVFLEAGGQPCSVEPGTPMPIRGLREEAFKARKAVYDNNFFQSPHKEFVPEGHFVLENVLFAPLLLQGEPVGLLGLANKPGNFTEHDAILASGFAKLAAIALVSRRAEEERAHLLQEVEAERSFLRAVVEQMPAGVTIVSPSGKLILGNQALKEVWGFAEIPVDLEEGLSRLQVLHPDGRPCSLEEWPLMRSLRNGETVSGVEADIIRPDGLRRTLRISSSPIRDNQGDIVAGVSACIDITARKLAEQALKESESLTRAIINSVPANIAVLGEDGTIVAVNEGWEIFVRESNLWSLEEAAVGANYLTAARRAAAAGDQDAAQVLAGIETVLQGSRKTFFMEFPCHHATQERWFMMYATPLAGGGGAVVTYVNITDRKRAEKQLQQAHDELEQWVQERTVELRRTVETLRGEIAEREKAEAKLRESEARFRTLLQTAGSYIATLTPEGHIIEFNREAERVTGWRRQEVEGKDGIDLFIPKEYRVLAEAELAKIAAGELIRGFELPIRLKDGSERLYLWNANAIWDNSRRRPVEIIIVGQDITERKQAEAALERERQRLLAVLETMPAYVALLAPDYTVPFANQEFIRRFGETEVGQRCYEFLFGRTEPCPDCRTFDVLKTNKPQQWEWLGPDGNTYAIYDYPFTDADGSPLILEMGVDITARKQAEEALREQSRILEAFFEHTITPLVFLDKEFNFIRVNKAYARSCHRQIADFPSRNYFDFFPDEENQALFLSVMKTRIPYQVSAQPFIFPERPEWGVSYWDWTLVPVLDDDGGVDFLVLSLNDVTQKVLAEEQKAKLHEILEATPDLVGTAEDNGKLLYLNQAGRRMLGLSPDEDLSRSVIADFHPPEVTEQIFNQALPVCRREGVWQGETKLLSRDGREIPISQVILAHRTPEGEVKFYSTVARDVSEMKQAEQKLRMLTSRLLTAQESERRRLSRELHDELGQSLMVLKLQTRALERQLPEGQEILRENCQRILKYIDEIIENVRRLSRDLSPSILEDLGLSAALNYLFEEFRRLHENLNLMVEQEPIDECVAAEKQINIFRVFQESLTNIAKHARATKVRVKLQRQDDKLIGMLQDNGVGFDMSEVQAREGLDKGLGLAAMDERLRIIGGSVQIISKKGEGTSIVFQVPLDC
ncbi:MAG: PAS domain S-box protein [Deltaproteobacteria bacterium]|nr:PAS domain S-box protein [Deltaproteobacteria bacterium]